MLLVDELPNAPKATQNALLQLILDKKIGTYTLPAGTAIIAAGNRSIDRAAVHEMPTPVKNRFAHYEIEANIDDWVAWAIQKDISPTIISFCVIAQRNYIHSTHERMHSRRRAHGKWLTVSYLSWAVTPDDEFYGVASLIGDGPAGEFIAFKQTADKMPDLEKLLASPHSASVPDDPSILFAVSGALAARADDNNFKEIMKYAKRMPAEYQVGACP